MTPDRTLPFLCSDYTVASLSFLFKRLDDRCWMGCFSFSFCPELTAVDLTDILTTYVLCLLFHALLYHPQSV